MRLRSALVLLPLALAACGHPAATLVATPAAKAAVKAAAPAPAAAKAGGSAVAAASTGYRAAEAAQPLPAPTDAYFCWSWTRNVYTFLLPSYDAHATLSFQVPNDPRITEVAMYFADGGQNVSAATPGQLASFPADSKGKYYVATRDADGRESARLGPIERPATPKRYGAPTVTARGAHSMTVAWTTDVPTVGYLRYGRVRAQEWHETAIEARPNGLHTATLTDLKALTRYTLVAFERRDGEDVEITRAARWTKLFNLFGSEVEAPESEAQMNADAGEE